MGFVMAKEKTGLVQSSNLKKTILLTGATGFLGSHLLFALLQEGYRVVVLKRSTSTTFRIDSVIDKVVVYDIDKSELDDIFAHECFNVIIHTATCYGREQRAESDIIDTNIVLGVKLLHYAVKHNVKIFINTDTFFNGDRSISSHMLTYTLSKKQFVEWLGYFSEAGVSVINMKLHHIYGPGDSSNKFVPWLQTELVNNSQNIKLTSGAQLRDFIYIDDVVNAFILALNAVNVDEKFSEYVVCTGVKTSVRDFSEELQRQMIDKYGSSTQILFGALPTSVDEIMDVDNDCSRLVSIGWRPRFSVEEGIKCMLDG